jgi:hypothetical protein
MAMVAFNWMGKSNEVKQTMGNWPLPRNATSGTLAASSQRLFSTLQRVRKGKDWEGICQFASDILTAECDWWQTKSFGIGAADRTLILSHGSTPSSKQSH